jgi:hypothetical protein
VLIAKRASLRRAAASTGYCVPIHRA